jgi:hypothetical protein
VLLLFLRKQASTVASSVRPRLRSHISDISSWSTFTCSRTSFALRPSIFRVFERASYRSSHTRIKLSARQHKAHPLRSSVYLEFSDSYQQVLQSQLSCFATLISHIARLFSANSVQLRFQFLPIRTFLQCLISTALLLRARSFLHPRKRRQVRRATKMAIMVKRTPRTCLPHRSLRLSSPKIRTLSRPLSHHLWERMEV